MLKKLVAMIALVLCAGSLLHAQPIDLDSSPALAIDSTTASETDDIFVAASFSIADVAIGIDINHTWTGDVELTLRSLTSTTEVDFYDNFCGNDDDMLITFASTGAVPFACADRNLGLGVRALAPSNSLDAFHGQLSDGVWQIQENDISSGDIGTLNQWFLHLDNTAAPPANAPNDLCADANPVVDGDVISISLNGNLATDTDNGSCATAAGDLWYVITTLSCESDFTALTCGFDASVTVYDGGCGVLNELGCSESDALCSGIGGEVALTAIPANTELLINVGIAPGASVDLTIFNVISAGSVANDACGFPEMVTNGNHLFDTTCATASGVNPGCAGSNPNDLWYEYIATCAGDVTVDTVGSGFDTRLGIYDSCGGTPIVCNDDFGGTTQSSVTFTVTSGVPYLIQVGGYNTAVGAGELNIVCQGSTDITGKHVVFDMVDPAGGAQLLSGPVLFADLDAQFPGSVLLLNDIGNTTGTPLSQWITLGHAGAGYYQLSAADGTRLSDIIDAGVCTYLHGGDVWGFDPVTDFNQRDGIDEVGTGDGGDFHASMAGLDFLAGFNSTYPAGGTVAGNDYFDQLVLADPLTPDLFGSDARFIMQDVGAGGFFSQVMYYDGAGQARVLSSSTEYVGIETNRVTGWLEPVLAEFGHTSTQGARFLRGDINDDMTVNIGDGVNLLAILFSGASFNCRLALDTNDDNSANIGDVTFLLAVLFGGTVTLAPPAAPIGTPAGSTASFCGVDSDTPGDPLASPAQILIDDCLSGWCP